MAIIRIKDLTEEIALTGDHKLVVDNDEYVDINKFIYVSDIINLANEELINYRSKRVQFTEIENSFELNPELSPFLVKLTNTEPININIMLEDAVPIQIGTEYNFVQMGEGTVTFTNEEGIIVRSDDELTTIKGLYCKVTLVKIASNEFLLTGSLV